MRSSNLPAYLLAFGLGVPLLLFLVMAKACSDISDEWQKRTAEIQQGPPAVLHWTYQQSPDKVSAGEIKEASVQSLNQVNFGFPYSGPQRATLRLRIHPRYGKNVILHIEKGQILCGVGDCTLAVRFDQGEGQRFSASEPADHSSTVLFIRNYNRFLAGIRKSKKVFVEAQFYQEGTRVFEFDVSNLTWE